MIKFLLGFFSRDDYSWWNDIPYKEAIREAMDNPSATDAEISDWCYQNSSRMLEFEPHRNETYHRAF